MPRANTRSLLSDVDMEDTGGLLATPRSAPAPVATNPLAEQIRSLYGNRGDWNYGGIDRAAELADLLQKQGITDVSRIALQKGTRQEQQFSGGEDGQMNAVDLPANQVLFGDKRIGFAGDYNNDNTYGNNAGSYLQGDNTLGWSARGHGNVTYKVGTDAQGNNYLMPEWGSSSDMKDVRNDLKAAAVIAAMAYGLPMLGEAAGAAGAGEAAAAGSLTAGVTPASVAAWEAALPSALAGAGETAAGLLGAGSLTAGLSPEAVAALEAGLPNAGTGLLSAAPAADTVQQIVTTGKLGSAPSLLSTVGPGAAAATVAATTLASNPAGSLTDNITADSVAKTEAGLPKQPGPLDGLKAWAAANPELAKLLFSGGGALLSAAGGPSSSSPGGYVDSGYRPTISREGWNPAPQARQMAAQPTGLLMPSQPTGQANSGLWRYANASNPASNMAMSAVTLPKTIGAATPAPAIKVPTPVTPAPAQPPAAQPLYQSLTANATPEQIAQAYRQFVAERGGDSEANRAEALNFLLSRGISQPVINTAYDLFKASEVSKMGAAPSALPGLTTGDTFAGGRALTERYKDLVKQESGFELPDLSPYTGRYLSQYTGELATPASRAGLINSMRTAQAQEAAGGYYQPGDLAPVIGGVGAQANSRDWWNNYYNSVFGEGNSYFLPDTSEVTYIPQGAIQAFRKPGETDEQVHNRLYQGNRFLGSGRADTSQTPEYSMRQLLNPPATDNPYNLLRENAGNLASFDVGRGSLTPEQGYATSRLLEAKDQYDMWNRTLNQYQADAASLQNELADFKAPTGWAGGDANLAQLKADKQASLDRLNAQIAAGNPFEDFYNKQLASVKTIDPAKYGGLSSGAVLRSAGLLGG